MRRIQGAPKINVCALIHALSFNAFRQTPILPIYQLKSMLRVLEKHVSLRRIFLLDETVLSSAQQQQPKLHENGCKHRDLLCVGALLEAWRFMLYTRWIHTVVCMMILLTDKAAQVINQ